MLYIHIPYCRKKCIYCVFFSGGAGLADWRRLRRALAAELAMRSSELPSALHSIYFGGGTPSLLPPEEFDALADELRSVIENSGSRIAEDCEVTIEVNPEDVDHEHIDAWKSGGVNRVSIGLQTFSDSMLKAIGRTHSGDRAERALKLLQEHFSNVSGDLIFGLPGQSVEDLSGDVQRLTSLNPQHISVYSLMYEEGTALTALRDAGRITAAAESIVADQYVALTDMLCEAGYEHYEISNYAKTGYRSRHNSGYWEGKRYLGIGPSAHSYDGRRSRRANPADLHGYLNRFAPVGRDTVPEAPISSDEPFYIEEILSDEELREERVMLGLRRCEGIDLIGFRKDFGEDALSKLLDSARLHICNGSLMRAGEQLHLTRSGVMISDTVIVDLI